MNVATKCPCRHVAISFSLHLSDGTLLSFPWFWDIVNSLQALLYFASAECEKDKGPQPPGWGFIYYSRLPKDYIVSTDTVQYEELNKNYVITIICVLVAIIVMLLVVATVIVDILGGGQDTVAVEMSEEAHLHIRIGCKWS